MISQEDVSSGGGLFPPPRRYSGLPADCHHHRGDFNRHAGRFNQPVGP